MWYRFMTAALLLCSLSSVTNAMDGLFLDLNSQYNYVNFVERDKGYAINEESGSIPTLGFTLGFKKPNQFYFEYSHLTGEGTIDYSGYSQVGASIQTRTRYNLTSDQYVFGKTFSTTVVFMGYQVNSRDRYIGASETTLPLTEKIKQKQGFIGFKQTVIGTKKYLVDFRFHAKMAFSSYMNVDFADQFDPSGLHLGMDYTLINNLYIGRKLPHDWMLGLNLAYEYTQIDQSKSVLLTRDSRELDAIFYHPYTEFETLSLGLVLSKNF